MKTIELQRNDVNYGNPLTVEDAVVTPTSIWKNQFTQDSKIISKLSL